MQGEVLVKLKPLTQAQPGVSIEADRLKAYGTLTKSLPLFGIQKIKLAPGVGVKAAIASLRKDPQVEYAEPNYIVHSLLVPNDPRYPSQWALPRISAPKAWDADTGSPDIVIAMIDTGLDYNHPDLKANVWDNPDPSAPDVHGKDFVNGDNDPMDDNEHGTMTAGITAAVGNNGTGIAGTAFTARLMALKALDLNGEGTLDEILSAIQYARANGARIANCSFGFYTDGGDFPKSLSDAISSSPDILFVCAAGNDGTDNDKTPLYPASLALPNVISVAASDTSDGLASFSNFGAKTVQIAAPGVDVLSTIPPKDVIFADSFDKGPTDLAGWVLTGSWGPSTAAFSSPPYSLSDSATGTYAPGTDSFAEGPPVDLSNRDSCSLNYRMKIDLPSGDNLLVEVTTDQGATWKKIGQFTGSENGFSMGENTRISLDAFSSMLLSFRFHLVSRPSSQGGDGVFIDNVSVSCPGGDYTGGEYDSGEGTSFSAPYATGTAALLLAKYPAASASDLKKLLMGGVDAGPSLNGMVSTSGRLDAFRAFFPPPPSNFRIVSETGTAIQLAWDDDPNESSYQLERAENGGDFSILATLPANTVTYTDSNIAKNSTYSYRLEALNGLGPSAYVSPAPPSPSGGGGGGGWCFIATAAFGSPLAREVVVLREFRDNVLAKNGPGRLFIRLYYRFSPPLAAIIERHGSLRLAARMAIYPVVFAIKNPVESGILFPLGLTLFGFMLAKIVKYGSMRNGRDRKGFTLLEILIVVAILSLLAAIVAPKIMGRMDDAKVADAKVQIRDVESGLKFFKLDNGFYPSTEQGLQALVEKPSSGRIPEHWRDGGYLEQKKVPMDPWGHPYVYICPGAHGDFDLSSLGGDGKEGGEGYDKDINNWEIEQ